MVLEGSAVGEDVDSGFIRKVRTSDVSNLERLRRAGLSDQKVAFINQELENRSAEAQGYSIQRLSEREAIRAYAEPRRIVKGQLTVQEVRTAKAIQNIPSSQRTAQDINYLRRVMEISGDYPRAQTEALRQQEVSRFYQQESSREKQRLREDLNKKVQTNYENRQKTREGKNIISRLDRFLTKAEEKSIRLGVERLEKKRALRIITDKEKRGEATKKQLRRAVSQDFRSFLKSFGAKAIETVGRDALALALLSRVPGLLKTREGRYELVRTVKNLPREVRSDLIKFGQLAKTNPEQAVSVLVTSLLLLKGTDKIFKGVGKLSKKTLNYIKNLDPRLLKIERGIVKTRTNLPLGDRLTLRVGSIADTKESLARQLRREGKSIVAVTAQASDVLTGIRRRSIVRKPLPFDEKKLTPTTRALLKRFDKGKLNARQTLDLNLRLRRESRRLAPAQPKGVDLLERSMYFDPNRTLRKSRLGLGNERAPEEGSLFDLLSGRATLRNTSNSPVVYVIEEFVEKLPRTKEFASIIRKIKASVRLGRSPNLTRSELAKLTRWQVTPSGRLKPIGSTTFQGGLEREVTIAPGEAIKKVKRLGVLKIGNQRIPIYAIRIIKGKSKINVLRKIQNIRKQISNLNKKRSSVKNIRVKNRIGRRINSKARQLEKIRRKSANKEIRNFLNESRRARRPLSRKKFYPLRRRLTNLASRARTRVPRRSLSRRTFPRRTPPRKTSPRRTPPRRTTPRRSPPRRTPSRRTTPRRVPPRSPPPKKPIVTRYNSRNRGSSKGMRAPKGWNVYVKSRGKFMKANRIPLSKVNAQNRASYIVDHSTSATAKLVPVMNVKRLGSIRSFEEGAKDRIKARTYRIRKGRRISLPETLIERRGKPRINTSGEKRGLNASRLIGRLNKRSSMNRRKITSSQRKELLKRLEKARSVRQRNLNRRRR